MLQLNNDIISTESNIINLILIHNKIIEPVNLIRRSNTQSTTLIDTGNLNIQNTTTSNPITSLTTSLLNQQTKRSSLKG